MIKRVNFGRVEQWNKQFEGGPFYAQLLKLNCLTYFWIVEYILTFLIKLKQK